MLSNFVLAEQSSRISNTTYSQPGHKKKKKKKKAFRGVQMVLSQPITRGNHLESAYNWSQMANGCVEAATSQKGLKQSEVPLNFVSTRATLKQQSRYYHRTEIICA